VKTGLTSLIGSSTLLAFLLYHLSLLIASSLAAAHLPISVGGALFHLYKRVLYAKVSLL
jgi:hypothetical protein